MVEVTGLEPATAWSQTRNATNCATPRCLKSGCKGNHFPSPVQIFRQLFDNTLLDENLLQRFHGAFYLLFRVGSHQGIAYQCVLRSTCRRYDRIDEYARLKGQSSYEECLVDVTNIQRNDGTLCIDNLETFFLETLQGVLRHLPQGLDSRGFLQQNVQSFQCSGCCCWCVGC